MKIGILGSGNVAQTLALGFLKHGHPVQLGTRDPSKLKAWKDKDAPAATLGSFKETAQAAEVIVLAVKGTAAASALEMAGAEALAGKVVIDTTNPIADAPPTNGIIQYFTGRDHQLWSATEWKGIDPTRQSVFNDPKYQAIAKKHTGFGEAFATSAPHMFNIMTPHPYFNELTTVWAATIQDIYMGKYKTVQAGMDQLAETMNEAFEELGQVE